MNFDDWVPMAEDRLREAAREVEKRPELKEEFESFLMGLAHGIREGDLGFMESFLEIKNPVPDVVSFDDLAKNLREAYSGSDMPRWRRFKGLEVFITKLL